VFVETALMQTKIAAELAKKLNGLKTILQK
jgi:hypothetical protein